MGGFDLVVRGGVVVDGTGAPPFRADIGVVGDTIVRIGDLSGVEAEEVIDARGLVVAPGFIDIHNHSDYMVFVRPTADNMVLQGVTTLVVGNCGFTPAPVTELNRDVMRERMRELVERYGGIPWEGFAEYMDALDGLEKSVNIAVLVGHGTVRSAVMGYEPRGPTERELREMQGLVEEAMRVGAYGVSTGLIYNPGMYAGLNELAVVARVAARYGGIYASHIRNEGLGLVDAVREAIDVGVASGASVEVSHLKASGRPAWGLVDAALRLIEYYVWRGRDVSADAYPYTASSTGLEAAMPRWLREGGPQRVLERLRDPRVLEKLVEHVEREGLMEERMIDWSDVVIAYSPSHPELEGMTLEQVAEKWGVHPARAAARLLVDDGAGTAIIIHAMSEEDVDKVMVHPLVAVGSDGAVREPGRGKPHPRNYGAFPRVIARYVRDRKKLTLAEAIRKMTSMPARKLGLWDRGIIRPGAKADLVVFNPYRVRDRATYQNPHQPPQGIHHVVVNGVVVVEDGRHTGAKPGRLLRNRAGE